jgi:AcrR family transcriptional regulator
VPPASIRAQSPADSRLTNRPAADAEPPRPGRRPGPTTTAQAILTQARDQFSRHGYAQTSLRAIADAAGVDPALIAHFFGSKRGLFEAAIEVPLNPDMPALIEFQTSQREPVERLAKLFLDLWDTPDVAEALSAIILEAAHRTSAAQAMARFMYTWVGQPITEELGVDHPQVRLRLMVGFIGAVALQRRFDPEAVLASLTPEQIVAVIVPTMRFILTNPLPPGLP